MPTKRSVMSRRVCAVAVLATLLLVPVSPLRAAWTIASVEILRPIFARMLNNPPVLRMDVVPDLYEGGYARISVYAEHADIKGMTIDQLWIRFVGASFAPEALRRGELQVLEMRQHHIYGRLDLGRVQDFLNRQGAVRDVHLKVEDEMITATGTIVFNGLPTRVRMAGVFQVYGEPEVFFHVRALLVNSLPVPYIVVAKLERDMNPIVDFRTWPVHFRLRSFRQSSQGFVLSSQADFSQPCDACGGPSLQFKP